MVSIFSPNIQLEEPARGDLVGVWDTPVNSNMSLLDSIIGGTATVGLSNSTVVLSAPQYQSNSLIFNGTLNVPIGVVFPTGFVKGYTVQNVCANSSLNWIVLQTGVPGGTQVSVPPGEAIDIINDGTNIKFRNLGRVGSYMDWAGSSVPAWVTASVPPPYLNCDGSTFSAATYPYLAVFLGGTTLPDMRGTSRATLNQGTGRITTAGSGLNGDARFSIGGNQLLQSHTHANTLTDPGHTHPFSGAVVSPNVLGWGGGPNGGTQSYGTFITATALSCIVINNVAAGGGGSQNMPPTTISGLTLIRAG